MTSTTPATDLLAGMPELPLLCGPLSPLTQHQRCSRTGGIYMLHTDAADIGRMADRLTRTRDPRRVKNLTNWITDAVARHARLTGYVIAELPDCTHPEDVRAALTVEQALPDCTC